MKKIGIITHYYKSVNFGGNLQAFALCRQLEKIGFYAEQIQTPLSGNGTLRNNYFKIVFIKGIGRICSSIKNKFFSLLNKKKIEKSKKIREESFFNFNQKVIPHSDKVYTRDNIKTCVKNYDFFITGSDQVWNIIGYNPSFFLDFVPSDKPKISYAASISLDYLTPIQQEIFKKHLKDFSAISVREDNAISLIKDISPVKPVLTLDPTLLLEKEDWNQVCAPKQIEEDYALCYFLGNNKNSRKIAKSFAKQRNIKLVTIPMCNFGYNPVDKNFGDISLPFSSPEQFLSLIKHAKYVFTDSFHAVVFSFIYQKEYYVFNRSKNGELSSRITNITRLFESEDRFCQGKNENLDYLLNLPKLDYNKEFKSFESLKIESINFLKEALGVH